MMKGPCLERRGYEREKDTQVMGKLSGRVGPLCPFLVEVPTALGRAT